jgi:tripartite-type tricarboxylate transporter receptor subunit TctC
VAKLNAEFTKIATLPEAQKVLAAAGLELSPSSPAEMRRIVEADIKKWGDLIKATGLKAE